MACPGRSRPESVALSDGVVGFMRGIATDITDANDAFLRMVGYTRDDLAAGRISWADMTPPEFLHLDAAGMKQASETGGYTVPYQKEFFRKDGSRVQVLLVCAFVPGRAPEWVGYVVDLSSPPRATPDVADMHVALDEPLPQGMMARLVNELVRERSRVVAMLDNTPALIWAVDREHRFLHANRSFVVAQEATTRRRFEVGDDVLDRDVTSEEQRRPWIPLYARVLAGERFTTEMSHPLPDRTAHVEYQLSPIRDREGAVVGATVVAVDQTTRHEAEAALRASDARFRSLATSLPVGVFLEDAPDTLSYVNPRFAEIFGRPGEELTGTGWRASVHPEDAHRLTRASTAARAAGMPVAVSFRVTRPDGTVRSVRWQARPADRSTTSGRASFVGTVEDETERLAEAARARQREKMESLGTLAGGIAHDFNNMLAVILGFAELAGEPGAPPDQIAESYDAIRAASLRARDLVRRILAFSRRSELTFANVDLRDVVTEATRLARAAIPASVTLDVHVPACPVVVRGEVAAVQQVLLNLCTNAEHALRGVPSARLVVELHVDAAPEGSVARIVVRDNGPGIPAAVADRIFEPFFTTKPLGEGTGMGLAVVHGIVASHGGDINVAAAPEGGTAFTVTLPLVADAAPAESVSPAAGGTLSPPRSEAGSAARVLVVDDEPAVASVVFQALRNAGFRVTVCGSADDALELVLSAPWRFDLLVSDVTMPGMRGTALAREVGRRWPALPCLLMSGHRADAPLDDLGGDPGTRRWLAKPFRLPELLEAVHGLLARRR